MAESMSTRRRWLYALGNPGFQITDRIVVLVVVYFYLPPPGRGLEPQVPEAPFLGFVTVFGIAMLFGRLFDTAADPLVGYFSDRSRSRLGRRRFLLVLGLLPTVGIPILLFFPPFPPGSLGNGVWLGGLVALYFVGFTAYVAPYFALIPEIAWTQEERLRLSQWMQIAAIPIHGVFVSWGVGIDIGREVGLSATESVRWFVAGASLVALVLCLGPILAVDEKRHARGGHSDLPFRHALLLTLRNRPFLLYLFAQLFFILGVNLFQPVFPYLTTVVLGRSEGFTRFFLLAMGSGIALGFLLQRPLVERYGPKRVLIACVGMMGLALAPLGLLAPAAPGEPGDLQNLVLCFVALGVFGVPAAGLMVLPHVIISQLVDEDERRTGASRAAMYFGVQGLMTKWMYGIAAWLFSYLLARFGNSPEAPLGILLVGPVAAILALVACVFYAFYPEREVLEKGSS